MFAAQAIWYAFFSQPAPAIGFLDFYVFGPLGVALERNWSVADLTLRERMGGGNFGQVYEGIINPPGGIVSIVHSVFAVRLVRVCVV